MESLKYRIDSMVCQSCVRSVTKAVQSVDPAAEVQADVATHEVSIRSDAPAARIEAALDEAGFETAPAR